ncbi:hypothetical protein RHGRI_033492 [Rhododendron griersonianum]|uniref:Uncharacterized protein n=1 Tax=Rhododendron griersonianum TaxID=479676 RepID=A0AAV6HZK3_9ERIC|nr:hypothetical protein RHGRI_033492 [Rhododendron griersonianum]
MEGLGRSVWLKRVVEAAVVPPSLSPPQQTLSVNHSQFLAHDPTSTAAARPRFSRLLQPLPPPLGCAFYLGFCWELG